MPTLDQMIQTAVFGSDQGRGDPTKVKTASARPEPTTVSEAEKIATALEFIGRRGVENLVKEASAAPPPGTNMGVDHGTHKQKTVKPHKAAPSMSQGDGSGKPDDTQNEKPGGSADQPHCKGDGQTHHSSLASNQAAIDFDKREKAKQVDSDLSALFDAKPFADGKLQENLTDAAGKGDKNIHKSAADREALKAALEKKLAEKEG